MIWARGERIRALAEFVEVGVIPAKCLLNRVVEPGERRVSGDGDAAPDFCMTELYAELEESGHVESGIADSDPAAAPTGG